MEFGINDPLDFSTAITPGATNTTGQINSNSLQLNSIPRMIYVYARTRNQDLYTQGTGCSLTDTYLALENINITFANYTGLLSSADKAQLYQIATKNGCGMNWTQWSGERENDVSNWNANPLSTPPVVVAQYGTIGNVLAIEFATDLGLPSDMCPGLQGQFQLQVNAQFRNTSNANINATLYIIIVSEGSFTIPGLNSATRQLGVITKNDILNAKSKPGVTYDQIQESQYGGGGNFLSNLANFGSKINDFLKNSKIISTVSSLIPHPISQGISAVSRNLGYGNEGGIVIDPSQYHDYGCGDGEGVMAGVTVGGRRLVRNELKHRLNKIY